MLDRSSTKSQKGWNRSYSWYHFDLKYLSKTTTQNILKHIIGILIATADIVK